MMEGVCPGGGSGGGGGNDKSREFRGDGNGLFRTRIFLDSLYQAGGV